jgi:hypothetical protein
MNELEGKKTTIRRYLIEGTTEKVLQFIMPLFCVQHFY